MKKYYLVFAIFLSLTLQVFPQNYFPLEIGNRWDYLVHIDGGTIGETYDSIAIEIIGKQILSNGLEYFEFSEYVPFWYYHPKFVREEETKIYYFDEEDSVDCFAFRFDLPLDSSYLNCMGYEIDIVGVSDSVLLWGVSTENQEHWFQWFQRYSFFDNFGIYHFDDEFGPIVEYYYQLKGCIISGITYGNLLVSADETETVFPVEFSLSQNYPNPFNPTTTINYQIPELSLVTLKVFDVLGNEIATLVNEEKTIGNYEVEFVGTGLPSGIYIYRIIAGSFVETKKMVLMK